MGDKKRDNLNTQAHGTQSAIVAHGLAIHIPFSHNNIHTEIFTCSIWAFKLALTVKKKPCSGSLLCSQIDSGKIISTSFEYPNGII